MEQRKCLIKSLKNELWNFMVDASLLCRPTLAGLGPPRTVCLYAISQ
jgi:hypothetical protein